MDAQPNALRDTLTIAATATVIATLIATRDCSTPQQETAAQVAKVMPHDFIDAGAPTVDAAAQSDDNNLETLRARVNQSFTGPYHLQLPQVTVKFAADAQ